MSGRSGVFRGAWLAVALFPAAAATPQAAAPGFMPIEVMALPITQFELGSAGTRFGRLEFRGGLQLKSRAPDFGSLSGLDFAADGRLYAVADTGYWFSAKLTEVDGRLTGVTDAQLAPILDQAGARRTRKRLGDAEGLRLTTRHGRLAALVSFEQVNNVRLFVAEPDLAGARPRPVELPPTVTGLRRNKGLEAIAVAPATSRLAGALVLIAERSPDANGNNRAWIVGGPEAGAFSVTRTEDFDVTDATFLPDGDLLILERKLNFPEGFAMRLRKIPSGSLTPGATADGEVLLGADARYQIDNMEGLAVRLGANGETLIDVVSDDNQLGLQRTLLLQFALLPPAAATAE
jgi:hypothetical protein